MASVRQPSFAGGELAPSLWGRTDLPRHAEGLRGCRNFFIDRHGAAVSRPGTVFVADTKVQTQSTPYTVRLVPFVYSDSQSYVLEFGHQYVRFHSNGAPVMAANLWSGVIVYALGAKATYLGLQYRSLQNGNSANTPSTSFLWWILDATPIPYEVATTYQLSELRRIKFVQSGDVLTLVHPSHAPANLSRYNTSEWILTDIDFSRPGLPALVEPMVEEPTYAPDASHPVKEWSWLVTEVRKNDRGGESESAPFTVTKGIIDYYSDWSPLVSYETGTIVGPVGSRFASIQNANLNHVTSDTAWWTPSSVTTPNLSQKRTLTTTSFVLYPDKPITIRMHTVPGLWGATNPDAGFIAYRVYRGRGGYYGFVGDTRTPKFVDVGDAPDLTRAPPEGRNPFKVYDTAGVLLRTERPSVVGYFDERRVFGATNERPATLFLSVQGDYDNFDRHKAVHVATDSLEYELACRRREVIRTLTTMQKMIPTTDASVWSFEGAGGAPLSASDGSAPDAKVQMNIGSNYLDPLVVANTILMARSKGTGVRDLFYDFQQQSYSGGDVSDVAKHLFTGHTIVAWAYAEDPWGLVWAVREDGKLLSLTYDKEAGVWAWCIHELGGSAAVEDVCVIPEGDEDSVYLAVRILGASVPGPAPLHAITYTYRRMLVKMATRNLPDVNKNGIPDIDETIALDLVSTFRGLDDGSGFRGTTTTITGLARFDQSPIYMLVDGVVAGPYTQVAGSVNIVGEFPNGGSIIHAGLKFTPEIELLDVGAERTKNKNVTTVYFELDAQQGLALGESFDNLSSWKPKLTSPGYATISAATQMAKVHVSGKWGYGGRAVLRQTLPLFVTVYGVTREVEFGGP